MRNGTPFGFLTIPGIAMSLGWGLRGFIGGGPLGAMIPGAMVALALCLLLRRERGPAGLAAAFGAVGIGFGGEMTYGETVGFALNPATTIWGLAGLAAKGAVWGLLGGAVLGTGLLRDRYARTDICAAAALMLAGTWIGWRFVNVPKLIYFSRSRPEIWAGLLLGALAWCGYLCARGRRAEIALFALAGMLGGGIGFGLGGAVYAQARRLGLDRPFDFWKVMEFTFGLCFGMALGLIAWHFRRRLAADAATSEEARHRVAPWRELTFSILLLAAAFWLEAWLPLRFSYAAVGAALICVLLFRPAFSWHVALSMTICGFALDLAEYWGVERKLGDPAVGWTAAVAFSLAVCCLVFFRDSRGGITAAWAFSLLMWSAVAASWLKSAMHPRWTAAQLIVQAVFTVMALTLARMAWGSSRRPPEAARGA
jgi:hypothetical protein